MTQLPPPGWYADPAEPERSRYWDGAGWADDGYAQAAAQGAASSGEAARTAPDRGPTPDAGQPTSQPVRPYAGTGSDPTAREHGQSRGGLLRPPDRGNPYGQPAGPGQRPALVGRQQPTIRLGGRDARLAAWWQRLLARIIDAVVVGAVSVLVCLPWLLPYLRAAFRSAERSAQSGGRPQIVQLDTRQALLVSLVSAVIYFGYDLVQHRFWGQTLGKRALRLRVARTDGSVLSWGRAAVRSAIWTLVPAIPTLGLFFEVLDGLWPLWDKPRRQAIHDKVAGTVVVQR